MCSVRLSPTSLSSLCNVLCASLVCADHLNLTHWLSTQANVCLQRAPLQQTWLLGDAAEFTYPSQWLADQRLYQRFAERVERANALDPQPVSNRWA